MPETNQDLFYLIGSGGVGVSLFIWMLRRWWQQFIGAKVEGKVSEADQAKAEADKTIYETLRGQVEFMAVEIKQIKIEHKQEKLELEHRIADLEAKVMRMSMRLGNIRRNAIDAYAELTSKECKSCLAIERAIEHIKKILEEE